jgi:competence protein ComEA
MSKTYYIFLALASVVSLGLGFLLTSIFYCSSSSEKVLSLKDFDEQEQEVEREDGECDFFVDVSGAVMEPSVVCLEKGSIVNDAIQKAQGFNPSAYAFKYVAQRVNLARILENEEKIYIPFRDDVVCTRLEDKQVDYISEVMKEIRTSKSIVTDVLDEKGEGVKSSTEGGCISLNDAIKEELMELSGVGETRAGDIIDGRPYSKLEDIKKVSGIGDATFEKIKDFICI